MRSQRRILHSIKYGSSDDYEDSTNRSCDREVIYIKRRMEPLPERIGKFMRSLEAWQQRWDRETNVAQGKKMLIPDIKACLNCGLLHDTISFGPCALRPVCSQNDDRNHSIIECSGWEKESRRLQALTENNLTADNIVSLMLRSVRNWRNVPYLPGVVLASKEAEERQNWV